MEEISRSSGALSRRALIARRQQGSLIDTLALPARPGVLVSQCVIGLTALLCVCFCVRASVFETFYIASSSMVPTLRIDDHIVVLKAAYGLRPPFSDSMLLRWSTPQRGEVVAFKPSDERSTRSTNNHRTMIKRVIGVAGDTVFISSSGVRINGQPLREPYAYSLMGESDSPQIFVVPDDSVFVLGDNRDQSFDSRFWEQPFVPVERVLGPVALVY